MSANTGGGGCIFQPLLLFPAWEKAVIIDERFSSGGSAADYIIDLLDRKTDELLGNPGGKGANDPDGGYLWYKALIINEYAASGGDLCPSVRKIWAPSLANARWASWLAFIPTLS